MHFSCLQLSDPRESFFLFCGKLGSCRATLAQHSVVSVKTPNVSQRAAAVTPAYAQVVGSSERERLCGVKCKDARREGAGTHTGGQITPHVCLREKRRSTTQRRWRLLLFSSFFQASGGAFVLGWLPGHAGWKFTQSGVDKPAPALPTCLFNCSSLMRPPNSTTVPVLCCLETVLCAFYLSKAPIRPALVASLFGYICLC